MRDKAGRSFSNTLQPVKLGCGIHHPSPVHLGSAQRIPVTRGLCTGSGRQLKIQAPRRVGLTQLSPLSEGEPDNANSDLFEALGCWLQDLQIPVKLLANALPKSVALLARLSHCPCSSPSHASSHCSQSPGPSRHEATAIGHLGLSLLGTSQDWS